MKIMIILCVQLVKCKVNIMSMCDLSSAYLYCALQREWIWDRLKLRMSLVCEICSTDAVC